MRKKQIIKMLEQTIIENQEELHFEESQSSRAYLNGMLDGVGFALKMLKPNSTVLSLTSTWWEDEPIQLEREREKLIELRYVDMEDPEPVSLFETAEAN